MWQVDSATWVRGLTDDAIEDMTDPGTFDRGLGYAEGGMVSQAAALNKGRVLVARVSGSGSEVYQTIVSLEGDPLDAVLEWSGRCTCPVGAYCKHCVAVLLAVRADLGGEVEAPATWEDALAGLTAPSAPERLDSRAPLALVVERVQVPRDRRDRVGEPRIRIRPTRRTKAGHWARKFTWAEARGRSQTYGLSVNAAHAGVADTIASLHTAAGLREYRFTPSGLDGALAVHLDDFGPEIWPLLRRAHDVGVALVASEDGDAVTLAHGPTDLVVDVVREPDGLRLRASVDVGGHEPCEQAPQIHLIGDPAHGVAVLGDTVTLAPFVGEVDAGISGLVADPQGLLVPEGDVDRFLAHYLPRVRERVTVVSSDGSVDLPEAEPPRLHVHVRAAEHGVRIDLGFAYTAGEQVHVVAAGAGGSLPRDARGESALLAGVEALDEIPGAVERARGSTHRRLRPTVTLRGPQAIRVLTEVVPVLDDDPRVLVVVDDDVPAFEEVVAEPQISLAGAGGDDRSDWLDLGITVTVGGAEVAFEPLFQALVRGDEIMQLPGGEWFRLDHPVLADLRTLIEEARALAEPEAGEVRLSRYQVDLWDELSDLGDVEIEREHTWRSSVEALRAFEVAEPPEPPVGLEATLRPYQLQGFQWLATLWDAGLGGVLADDMGLGKTVQALALLARAAEAGDLDRPVLVVAPTSMVGTWASEAARFVPRLDVRTLGSTHRRRGTSVAEAVEGAQLVVTSYAVLRIDADQFGEVGWRGLVLDEAQFVKNSKAKTHQALRRLSAPFVLAVTGTPLENSLMDLWSLFALAAPGLYPRRDRFSEVYRKPIESGAQPELLDRLRRRIKPLMLRRTKEQVAIDLPPKQVQVLPVDLTPTHRRVYDRHLQRERKRVLGLLEDPDANRVAILASLTRLRQLSLDPGLVDEEERGHGSSAKIDLLVDQLLELAGEGHRALVFSQFTRFLTMVRERLEAAGVGTSYLDGATKNRARVVRDFREGDDPAFLISLKAGGTGLTLTEADYVFVLDPWWNPAAEAQAIDRAHRIGQDKPVMVYRLVSTGTIEEKVVALQERKRDLFERVVDDGGALSGAVSADDVRALLEED